MDVAPGLWEPGAREGLVSIATTTEFGWRVEPGAAVGVVAEAAAQTRACRACSSRGQLAPETLEVQDVGSMVPKIPLVAIVLKMPIVAMVPKIPFAAIVLLHNGGSTSCRHCGSVPESSTVLQYQSCGRCTLADVLCNGPMYFGKVLWPMCQSCGQCNLEGPPRSTPAERLQGLPAANGGKRL